VYQGAALGWGVLLPPGMIAPYVGAAAPGGWLLCDGSQVSQTTYAALYAAIGVNKFGTDTGGNFYLPDLRGRVPVGQAPAAAGGNADVQTIGNTEGAAIGSRRPKHLHSTSVSETTTGNQSYASIVNNTNFASGSGIAQRAIVNTSQAGGISGYEGLNSFNTSPNHTHSVGVTVGPQSNSPTDGPAYITLGFIIKF
jgi:microcystin-dependent protein